MATLPNAIKGRLLFVPDGKSTEDALELGDLEIPLRIQVGTSAPVVRAGGGPNAERAARGMPPAPSGFVIHVDDQPHH